MKTTTKKKPAVKRIQPGRIGLVLIGTHFRPEVQRELKILAARQSRTVSGLLYESLGDLFKKYDLPNLIYTSLLDK
jgi:hypothetical protein